MPLASASTCANAYQITKAFLHPQETSQAFQLSEKQLECLVDLSRPGDPAKNIGAESLLPFTQEPGARTEPTFAHVEDLPLRIYKNKYDQPPVSYLPKSHKCVYFDEEGSAASVREAKERGWVDQRYAHEFGISPSTEKNAKDDQPSMDEKDA